MMGIAKVVGVNVIEGMIKVAVAGYQATNAIEASKAVRAGKTEGTRAVELSTILAAEGMMKIVMLFLSDENSSAWQDRVSSDINNMLVEALASEDDDDDTEDGVD